MASQTSNKPRIVFFDTLRGFTLISMILFHTMWDIANLYGSHAQDIAWYFSIQGVWRCSISWVFIALAGNMTSFSRNNLKRAAVYGAAALAVCAVTYLAEALIPGMSGIAINFGILFCMAVCTLIFSLAKRPLLAAGPWLPIVLVALFIVTYQLPWMRPAPWDNVKGLAWLGFPSSKFSSADYYPVIPFVFLYLTFAWIGNRVRTWPSWMRRDLCAPLSWLGRHSLAVYLLHQPIVALVLAAIYS